MSDISSNNGAPVHVAPNQVDHDRIAFAVREILAAVGEDPDRDGLLDTPARVARMYAEIFSGIDADPSRHLETTFSVDHDELVMVRDIQFHSMCEHHLLPFFGMAHCAYIPSQGGQITGLSKLARLVDGFASRPQVQERLTRQIASAINDALDPQGVLVVLDAQHMCMSMRGVGKPGASTVTSSVLGTFRDNNSTRLEAMQFLTGNR